MRSEMATVTSSLPSRWPSWSVLDRRVRLVRGSQVRRRAPAVPTVPTAARHAWSFSSDE
jgi:hypothetical protein